MRAAGVGYTVGRMDVHDIAWTWAGLEGHSLALQTHDSFPEEDDEGAWHVSFPSLPSARSSMSPARALHDQDRSILVSPTMSALFWHGSGAHAALLRPSAARPPCQMCCHRVCACVCFKCQSSGGGLSKYADALVRGPRPGRAEPCSGIHGTARRRAWR